METANLEIKNLSKSYGEFSLSGVSFNVPKGSIVGFIGENGAGKTTTIKLILNMIHKDGGDIRVFGLDHRESEKEIKEKLGVVLDETYFHDNLRPGDIAAILRRIYPEWDDAKYAALLSRFGLPGNKTVKEFSKGMKTKLSITAALSHNPRMLILDEATSGLDPVVRSEILDVFRDYIQDEDRSILISSHITSDLEKVADYIVFIHKGRIVLNEPKDELLYDYCLVKCGNADFDALSGGDIIGARRNGFGCSVLMKNREQVRRRYPGLVIDNVTLEDIMTYIAGRENQ